MGLEQIQGHFPGLTKAQIGAKARKLGTFKLNTWTDIELSFLQDNYLRYTYEELQNLLPRHTAESIRSKAKKMGLPRKVPPQAYTKKT